MQHHVKASFSSPAFHFPTQQIITNQHISLHYYTYQPTLHQLSSSKSTHTPPSKSYKQTSLITPLPTSIHIPSTPLQAHPSPAPFRVLSFPFPQTAATGFLAVSSEAGAEMGGEMGVGLGVGAWTRV